MPFILGEPTVQQYFDENGDPLENGTIEFYESGTSTPLNVYSDSSGTSAGTSVTLGSLGQPLNGSSVAIALFFDASKVYKIVRKDSSGTAIDPTIDPYYGSGGGGSGFTIDAVDSGASDSLYDYVGTVDGQQASVAGYYTPGDGGGGLFVWDADNSDADDGGSVIVPTGQGATGRWVRVVSGAVSVKEFGAKGDDSADDASAFQNCITYAAGNTPLVNIPEGDFVLGSTIEVPVDVRIKGAGAQESVLRSKAASTYYDSSGTLVAGASGGFLFFMNIDPASPSTWVQNFPNMKSGGIEDISVDGSNTSGINLAYFGGSHYFKRIQCSSVNTAIEKPGLYCDSVVIEHIHHDSTTRPNTTDYLVYLPGLGDSVRVAHMAAGRTSGGDYCRGLYLALSRGAEIRHLINGRHYFLNSGPGVSLSHCHIEGGDITLDAASVNVHDNIFFNTDNNATAFGSPIKIVNDSLGSSASQGKDISTIQNNTFMYILAFAGGWPTTEVPDIDTGGNAVRIGHNARDITVNGAYAWSQTSGIKVGNGATIYDAWQNYSHILSTQTLLISEEEYTPINGTIEGSGIFNGWTQASLLTVDLSAKSVTWEAATGTYYYGIQVIYDPVRLIGRDAATVTETFGSMTNGGNVATPLIAVGNLPSRAGKIFRIYRGTSSGSYDKYVDIHCLNVRTVLDTGDLVNGIPWTSRSAAGVDTLNSNALVDTCQFVQGKIRLDAVAGTQPTVGTWQQGDKVDFVNVTSVPSIGSTATGRFLRLTDSANHVDGTDWIKYVWERG